MKSLQDIQQIIGNTIGQLSALLQNCVSHSSIQVSDVSQDIIKAIGALSKASVLVVDLNKHKEMQETETVRVLDELRETVRFQQQRIAQLMSERQSRTVISEIGVNTEVTEEVLINIYERP
jgi:hypothetical protein